MPLPTSTASAQGVDARGILALVDALESHDHDPHSLVLARHGHVIARGWWAPYSSARVQLVYSLSKSFTATAVGLLVDDGRVSLEDRVVDLLPASDLPPRLTVPDRYRRLTLRQCLTMSTGHDADAWSPEVARAAQTPSDDGSDPVLAAILAAEPEHEPGTAFAYNQVATYLVAAVVRALTGADVLDLVRQRLLAALDPVGAPNARWHRTATGRELGFSGIHVGTDAVLALAQLHLDGGTWNGTRLLSPEWVATATRPSGLPNREPDANPDWRQGYGCSFWGARHGYRGDGAYGQFAIVLPEQDVTLAITGETPDMQGVLDLVWEHLLPALDHAGDAEADEALAARLGALRVPTPAGRRDDPQGGGEAGPRGGWEAGSRAHSWVRSADSTLPEAYAAVRLERDGDGAYRLLLNAHGTEVRVQVGEGTWLESSLIVAGRELPVEAAGGWDGPGLFAADLRLIETPHTIRLRTRPDGTAYLGWRELPLMGADPLTLAVRGSALPARA